MVTVTVRLLGVEQVRCATTRPVPSPSVLAGPMTAQRMELNVCVVWRDSVVLQTRGVR